MPATLFDKLWNAHRVTDAGDGYDLLAIDRLLLHERTGGVALKELATRGLAVKDPNRVFAIMDHIVSFRHGQILLHCLQQQFFQALPKQGCHYRFRLLDLKMLML